MPNVDMRAWKTLWREMPATLDSPKVVCIDFFLLFVSFFRTSGYAKIKKKGKRKLFELHFFLFLVHAFFSFFFFFFSLKCKEFHLNLKIFLSFIFIVIKFKFFFILLWNFCFIDRASQCYEQIYMYSLYGNFYLLLFIIITILSLLLLLLLLVY